MESAPTCLAGTPAARTTMGTSSQRKPHLSRAERITSTTAGSLPLLRSSPNTRHSRALPQATTGTASGRGFAVVGGVAGAVKEYISRLDPELEVKTEFGDGLKECKKMLLFAKKGMRDGYLLEGMACPGGCVAGAGTIAPVVQATAAVNQYAASAEIRSAGDSPLLERLKEAEK